MELLTLQAEAESPLLAEETWGLHVVDAHNHVEACTEDQWAPPH